MIGDERGRPDSFLAHVGRQIHFDVGRAQWNTASLHFPEELNGLVVSGVFSADLGMGAAVRIDPPTMRLLPRPGCDRRGQLGTELFDPLRRRGCRSGYVCGAATDAGQVGSHSVLCFEQGAAGIVGAIAGLTQQCHRVLSVRIAGASNSLSKATARLTEGVSCLTQRAT
jgi:hypothetical protein